MKTVIVTGGAQGIGYAIATRFRSQGANVIIVDKNRIADEDFASRQIIQDLCESSAVDKVYGQLPDKFDVLINCAGIYPTTPAVEISAEEWTAVVTLDLTVPFLMSQRAAQQWIAQNQTGIIVQISSTAASVVRPGIAHYGSAKAGLSMLTRVLAVEWAQHGIRVNAVGPGLVITERGKEMLEDPVQQWNHAQKLTRIPLARTADPDEIASVVEFLASDSASYMTGQTVYVDGGYTAGFPFQQPKEQEG